MRTVLRTVKIRLGLTQKVQLLIVGVLVTGGVLSLALIGPIVNWQATAVLKEELQLGREMFEEFRELQLRETRLASTLPEFQDLIRHADGITILDVLNDLTANAEHDLLLVTNATGAVLTQTDMEMTEDRLASQLVLESALNGNEVWSVLTIEETIYDVNLIPVRSGRDVIGVIVVGFKIDDAALERIGLVTGSEISFVHNGTLIASTLPSDIRREITEALRSHPIDRYPFDSSTPTFNRRFGGDYGYLSLPILLTGQRTQDVHAYLIQQSRQSVTPLVDLFEYLILISGALIGLLMIVLSHFWLKRILSPLSSLITVIQRVAVGDVTQHCESRSSEDEIGRLTQALQELVGYFKDMAHAADRLSRKDQTVNVAPRSEHDILAKAFNRMAENLTRERAYLEDQVCRRTSDLNIAKEIAEAASRAKSTFLANMSHELRTPLNAIIGYSDLLMESAEEPGKAETIPDLVRIHAAGQHLLRIISDILDLSKIEAGKMSIELESVDVSDLIDDAVTTVALLAMRTGNTVQVSVSNDLGFLHADRTRLKQILLNLLSNACKFTEKDTIVLTAARTGVDGQETIKISVTDHGIGMSQDEMKTLFQPFTQGDASSTRKHEGTGLGLAISRRFCQIMGGDITVTSDPGVGSTFTIELPVVRYREMAASSPGCVVSATGAARPQYPEQSLLTLATH